MKIGFLFPGQGSQTIGMGKDIYENYEVAKNVYERVKNITNIDIAKLSFEGPEESLNQTKYTQLAILTMSLAIIEILNKNNIKADIAAGLSLGEYSALIYSKAISFEEGIKLVQKRGEYMQDLLPEGEWQMAAIMGMTDEQVEEVCKKVTSGFVVPANYNCVGQIAISGEKQAISEAEKIAKEMGVKKVRVLKTAGPFHTEKLIESSQALRKELDNITIYKFNSKVVKNLDGTPYTESDDVKDILAKHIINPVRFSKSLESMMKEGVDTFIEIGPGKTLSGFVKRQKGEREINILNINNVKTLEDTMEFLEKGGK
ncbi:MAG: ACP S-malonyltransferase [Clostridia bacterium]|nr:ACP S-malonyltransferase [Clostridia bacterium]